MDSETRKEFDKMQALIKKPACFGEHGTNIEKCPGCWYHPDCKIETKKVKTEKPKPEIKKQSKPKQYKSNQSGGKK